MTASLSDIAPDDTDAVMAPVAEPFKCDEENGVMFVPVGDDGDEDPAESERLKEMARTSE